MRRAERDVVALGIAAAAVILFIGTGGTVLPQVTRSVMGTGATPDMVLSNAFLLNIALIIFSWRRYRELTQEVRERRDAEQKAQTLAETDPLTGLLNRRSIAPATAQIIQDMTPGQTAIAMLMLDLDNFKQINDMHGHKIGDAVLEEMARRMVATIPPEGTLARIGGDEFAYILPFNNQAPQKIDQLAGEFIEQIARPISIGGQNYDVTLSVGISRADASTGYGDGDGCAQTLLHQADIAMYHAKKNGRNCYFWFEAPMESELRFRNDLESGIRSGIAKGEFVPYYEQQIDLENGTLVGFEMLARWNSPHLGLVNPDIFIPIAEEIGVIDELSENLMQQAFRDAKEWDPSLTLSVNISPIQLRDPWFSQKLLRLLLETGFPPARLDIEITESCLHENIAVVRSVVTSLKNQGIHISLDDFGTGYSSLAQLRSLPFDRIKIDRSFVSELAEDRASSKIVEAIISLARGLDMPITAEGIESAAVLDILRQLGPLKGQGYLYGHPENAANTHARLARQHLLSAIEEAQRAHFAGQDDSSPELPLETKRSNRAIG